MANKNNIDRGTAVGDLHIRNQGGSPGDNSPKLRYLIGVGVVEFVVAFGAFMRYAWQK